MFGAPVSLVKDAVKTLSCLLRVSHPDVIPYILLHRDVPGSRSVTGCRAPGAAVMEDDVPQLRSCTEATAEGDALPFLPL